MRRQDEQGTHNADKKRPSDTDDTYGYFGFLEE